MTTSVTNPFDPLPEVSGGLEIPLQTFSTLDVTRMEQPEQPVKVFCCHGGGVRAIIQLRVIYEIEKRTKKSTSSLFDYMCGTSAGSMLVLALSTPSLKEPASLKPHWTAAQLMEKFPKSMGQIFPSVRMSSLKHVWGRKYEPEGRNEVCSSLFGQTRLQDALTEVSVPILNLRTYKTPFVSRTAARTDEVFHDLLMADLCQAATSAPTFFPPKELKQFGDKNNLLIDAGLGVNNPTLSGCLRARRHFGENKKYLVVSVGTGELEEGYVTQQEATHGGVYAVGAKYVTVMGQAHSFVVDEDTTYLIGKENLFSISPTIDADHINMDNSDSKNLAWLEDRTSGWITENDSLMRTLCKKLVSDYT